MVAAGYVYLEDDVRTMSRIAREVEECSLEEVCLRVQGRYLLRGTLVDFSSSGETELLDALAMCRAMAGTPAYVKWQSDVNVVRRDLARVGKTIEPEGLAPLYAVIAKAGAHL